MRIKSFVLPLLAMLTLIVSACSSLPKGEHFALNKPQAVPFILISIDGFRADYLDRGMTPNMRWLADNGVSAAMRPSYPSMTFPNHYTLVTGKVPDRHGIVNNMIRDVQRPDKVFKLSDLDQVNDRFWWDEATPFWVSAEREGIKTGVNWPGAASQIQGQHPSYWNAYVHDLSNSGRVDQVLGWLDLSNENRPIANTIYFDEVDTAGHNFGPDSQELNVSLGHVDEAIGRLMDGLKARGLWGKVNIIIVSDHGMTNVAKERAIYLDQILPKDSYELVFVGTILGVNPRQNQRELVEKALLRPFSHMQCWRKSDIPKRLRYGTHRRVPAIICMPELGYVIGTDPQKGIGYKAGAHGYDPQDPQMASIFIANGPAFKSNVHLKTFDNVDVYSLEMWLLQLPPEPNDGSLTFIKKALN